MTRTPPPPRIARLHHHVLTILLYGEHEWLIRGAFGKIIVKTAGLRAALGRTRAEDIYTSLERLLHIGVIEKFNWFNHYFVVDLRMPQGGAWITLPPAKEVQ